MQKLIKKTFKFLFYKSEQKLANIELPLQKL